MIAHKAAKITSTCSVRLSMDRLLHFARIGPHACVHRAMTESLVLRGMSSSVAIRCTR